MTDPMTPVNAPADTENPLATAVETWLSSPTIRDDATTLAYAYALAWALGRGDGLPEPSLELSGLVDVVMQQRKVEIRDSFHAASTALLTNLEQGGVGMWVPFETHIS